MCVRYIGFVLLVWFAGVLHALSVPQHCEAPLLSGGYLVPEQDTYPDNTTLTYACDKDRKPVVEGWWAKSTCHDGKWTHVPECINETACITPTIPNEKKPESSKAWYEDGKTMRITCDEGYEHKDHRATAKCIKGEWSRVLVCEKSIQACSEPPRIPHAVIIHQRYQEVFAVDSKLRYECEDGYTVEGAAESNKFITCTAGAWTEGPLCKEGGIGGGNTASAGKGPTTRPELYETENNPPITSCNRLQLGTGTC
ncbi:complement factor H-related protein 1-like [Enoplosus armatus]|uniref:complement factor H-related protein 1-like n=1 Tax=Enoplosus armatus TaxID=215367 RepID=UPI003991420E